MSSHLSSSAISKLGHEILEIRIRALKHIEGKFRQSLESNEELVFNPGNLLKHLIRWFGLKPLSDEETVLKMIFILLKSQYGREAIRYLTKERLLKEFYKVEKIVASIELRKLILDIIDFLMEYQSPQDMTNLDKSKYDDSSLAMQTASDILIDESTSDYEIPWSIPCVPDYNSLKLLSESLTTDDEDDLQHAFNYLETAIDDFPAEYFLQPPYIFNSLVLLYKKNESKSDTLLRLLMHLTKSLSGRIKKRQLSMTHCISTEENKLYNSKMQITTQRFSIEVFQLCIEHYRILSEQQDQSPSPIVLQLQQEVLEVISNDLHSYDFRNTILIDLGDLAKYYRQSFTVNDRLSGVNRMCYISVLHLIVEILNIETKKRVQLIPEKSHYNPENYASNSMRSNHEIEAGDSWVLELECALFDYPLKEMYPELYGQIKVYSNVAEKNHLKVLLHCDKYLSSAVTVLRRYDEMPKERLIIEGSKAADSLLIHKNLDFVRGLVRALTDCIPLYDGNSVLRTTGEKLLLRLLSHEDNPIRRVAYKECSDKVKHYFASAMNGEISLNKLSQNQSDRSVNFGIPLTSEILNELCNGCIDEDALISANAEIILILVLKAKSILGQRWDGILQILLPNMPLLEAIAMDKARLGELVLKLYDPDAGLSHLERVKGNLRFLFANEEVIRRQALSRIIMILSMQSDVGNWIPNVVEISDTILDDICLLNSPRSSEKIFTAGLYEKNTVTALLELLRSPDVEPAIRKTTLLQLNVMSQDPELAEFIHDQNGCIAVLQALDNSLKKRGSIDYPDAAMPAIGIITKIALCQSQFRRELSEELNIYYLLMRALFLYPHDQVFKQDCILLLFLLVYSSILIGDRRQFSVSYIFRKLKLPLNCNFSGKSITSLKRSALEEAYVELMCGNDEKLNHSRRTATTASSTLSSEEFRLDISRFDGHGTMKESALQFIRLTLATLWFDGLENLLIAIRDRKEGDILSQSARSSENEYETSATLRTVLQYNSELLLRSSDIELVKLTSIAENITMALRDAENATTHSRILNSIAKIQLCSSITARNLRQHSQNIQNTFKRYIITPPSNTLDITVFENIIGLFAELIEAECDITLVWILKTLQTKHCLFLRILKDTTCVIRLYAANCRFLQILIKECLYYKNQSIVLSHMVPDESQNHVNVYNKLFEISLPIADECFRERDIDRFRIVLNVMQFLSASQRLDLDSGFSCEIIKKMINFIISLKSFTQTGSHINKNCLLIVRNIMDGLSEPLLSTRHLKCLSGLCGHGDFEIRALSWSCLEKLSRHLKGAHSLVKELSFLPGGFHACALSTFLDSSEVPIVRAAAGGLLSNLLTFTKDTPDGKILNLSVAPLCSNLEPSVNEDGLHLLMQLFARHRFYDSIEQSLDLFYISDVIIANEKRNIVTCDIVKMYCSILNNFTELHSEMLSNYLEYPCIRKIFQTIKMVAICVTENSLDMLGEICNLLGKFLRADGSLLISFTTQDPVYVQTLVGMVDLDLFDNVSKRPLIQILQVLRIMTNETLSYRLILEALTRESGDKFYKTICLSINSKDTLLQRASLEFLTALLIKGQTEPFEFDTFSEILDKTELIRAQNESCNDPGRSKAKNYATRYASEVIFAELNELFIRMKPNAKVKHSCEKHRQLTTCCEAIGVLLLCSEHARRIAEHLEFFEFLLAKLQANFDEMRVSCSEFIRKYGDTKKQPVIDEFILIYEIMLNWFAADRLTDEWKILLLTKISLNTWPWINHSTDLRMIFLKLLAFLSDNSLAVCKQFSSTISGHSCTVLQQLIALVTQETMKVKSSQIDLVILEVGLRTISNCCSCIEGRLLSVKLNVFDIFNKFHPSTTKSQKSWNPIIVEWLRYWEIFSRYPEGATVRHLHLLGILIVKSTKQIRLLCLTILRNMAFVNENRAALYSSEDFLYISKSILEDGTREEQKLVGLAIWKLVAGNFKAKHAIKSTSIPKRVRIIQGEMAKSCDANFDDDLFNILETLSKILE